MHMFWFSIVVLSAVSTRSADEIRQESLVVNASFKKTQFKLLRNSTSVNAPTLPMIQYTIGWSG